MAFDIEIVELAPQPVLVIEAKVAPPQLAETLASILPRVHGFVTANGGVMTGMPFMRYLDMTDGFLIDAGIPVEREMPGQDDIVSRVLPGGRTATTLFLGEYHRVGEAWDALFAWGEASGIEKHFGGWDIYENDPTEVDDPSQIRTRLCYPLIV